MKSPEYYERLPDDMTVDQLDAEFREILSVPASDRSELVYVDSLHELSERQWHTYNLLGNDLRDKTSLVLTELWKDDDVEMADTILGITGMLGLPSVMDYLSSRPTESFSPDVKKSVRDAFKEFGATISDPYARM